MRASRPLITAALLPFVLTLNASRVMAETAAALSIDAVVDTRAIELTAPASGSFNASPVTVAFLLPRNARPNTAKLTLSGSVTRELTLSSAFEAPGTHTLTFDPANPTATESIASGESIPDGTYTLTLYYQDTPGNPPTSNAATNVTIDRTSPTLTIPADIAVQVTGDGGATVSYPAATATDTIGVTSLTYSKASSSLFPIGVTTVTATAKDAAGNTSVGTFTVTVNGVQIAVEQPADTNLTDASPTPIDFGTVVAGNHKSLSFLIRSQGTLDLSGLEITKAAGGAPGDFTIDTPPPATLAPGSTANFTVTFSPTSAGKLTATLLIANNDPDENPFEINLTGKQAAALEAWRITYFGSPSNTGPGSDLNDPDADGIVNLLEFATASDPTVSTPPPGHLIKNGNQLEFTYTRPTAATSELTYTPETTSTLTGQWLPADPAATTVLSDNGQLQQVKVTIPAGPDGKLLLRLRVIRP